jgi:hypothetical protein
MVEKKLSLPDILKALPGLTKDDVDKLYSAVAEEGRKKGCAFARRGPIESGHAPR